MLEHKIVLIFSFVYFNICFGYPQHMFKLMNKKIIILNSKYYLQLKIIAYLSLGFLNSQKNSLRCDLNQAPKPFYRIYFTIFTIGLKTWPRGYKSFFMLNSAEHEIYLAHKC